MLGWHQIRIAKLGVQLIMSLKLAQSVAAVRLLAATTAVALVVACDLRQSDRFAIVTGAGYEGAIVKAADVPSKWRLENESAWTPSANDVRLVETELLDYLRGASLEPLGVVPPMIFEPTRPPGDVTELRELIRGLPDQRRQYFGIARGAVRFLVVSGFPKGPYFDDWRNRVIAGFYDYGCALWTARFDMTSHKLVSFGCSGSA